MRELTEIEKIVYNKGERLIPGVTHNAYEANLHSASYSFFWEAIMNNLVQYQDPIVDVLDLGCGVGWGCDVLSTLPNSQILGIDNSPETIEYAKNNYPRPNVEYQVADLTAFISKMPAYPYVVSRGVFEHIADGLKLLPKVRFSRLFLFDVPYDEPPENNPHHLLTRMTEKDFTMLSNAEFFYEDTNGIITREKPKKTNMLMCVCRR